MTYLKRNIITTYEYEKITLRGPHLNETTLEALEKYHGENESPYFSLIHKGVKFKQFVGVIQVGDTVIEVLPKIDRLVKNLDLELEESLWRDILIKMLRITLNIDADLTSKADLKLRRNSILDLYFELFIAECEKIVHQGRIKKYRRISENKTALKGKFDMPRHIMKNIVHKERFFVKYNTYDYNHLINQILNETLRIIATQFPKPEYHSRLKNLLLAFEDCDRLSPDQKDFDKIIYNRKNSHYQEALDIARLIIFNYHPDISTGRNNVLALMFDMNDLWEKFIGKMLRRHFSDSYIVKMQKGKVFWKSEKNCKRLKPDFVLTAKDDTKATIIMDTKWKLPKNKKPSDADLRQMFAYNRRFESNLSFLLYPGRQDPVAGEFKTEHGGSCQLLFIDVLDEKGNLLINEKLVEELKETINDETRLTA